MKTKLFFLLCSVLLLSCSSSDDNNGTNTIVPTKTGAITDKGVEFNNSNLKVESATFSESGNLRSTFKDIDLKITFNDNIEVIITAENYDTSKPIPNNEAYDIMYKYATKITFNFIENNKVKESEIIKPKDGKKYLNLTSSKLNTFTLDFKDKHEYKGEIVLPTIPETIIPEIVERPTMEQLLRSAIWKSNSKDFLSGTTFNSKLMNRQGEFYAKFYAWGIELSPETGLGNGVIYDIKYTETGFYIIDGQKDELHYTVNSISKTEVDITYDYILKRGWEQTSKNIPITLTKFR